MAVTAKPIRRVSAAFQIQAAGSTAAMHVTVNAFCDYQAVDKDREATGDFGDIQRAVDAKVRNQRSWTQFDEGDLLNPGMMKSFQCNSSPTEELNGNVLPSGMRYLVGRVTYGDVYHNQHATDFCFYQPWFRGEVLDTCPKYNHAD